jgi:hypothetical protein
MNFLKSFKTLFVGGRIGPSMGRVAFWPVYLSCLYTWLWDKTDIHPFQYATLATFLGYILYSKVSNNRDPLEADLTPNRIKPEKKD